VLLVAGLPLALLALWRVASADSQSFYLPPLREILQTFASTWPGARLVDDVLPSVARLLAGFALAAVLGVAVGVVVGSSRRLRAALEPVLEFLRAIPPPVLVPIFILVAGIGTTMKVLVIVSGCVWPILLNTVAGVRARDEVLEDTCRAYGIRGAARLRHLVLRAASPQIVTGMRQALSIGIILMVISEMFAASSGLVHHHPVPAWLRHRRDVERHPAPGPARGRPVARLPGLGAPGAVLVPRPAPRPAGPGLEDRVRCPGRSRSAA